MVRGPIDLPYAWVGQGPVSALQLGRWIDAAVPAMPNRAQLLRAAHSAGAKRPLSCLASTRRLLAALSDAWQHVCPAATVGRDCEHGMVTSVVYSLLDQ